MSQEEGMRARVAGRMAVAGRTAWQLDVGGARLRCLREGDLAYLVQYRDPDSGRWRSVGSRGMGSAPAELLERVVRVFARLLLEGLDVGVRLRSEEA